MSIPQEYSLAYAEVLEVLKYLTPEQYSKLPKERIEIYEEFKDKNYEFLYNPCIEMETQIRNEAKAELANIFIKYIASTIDKQTVFQQELQDNYNADLSLNQTENEEESEQENMQIVVVKQKNFFEKVICKIKSLFKVRGVANG